MTLLILGVSLLFTGKVVTNINHSKLQKGFIVHTYVYLILSNLINKKSIT